MPENGGQVGGNCTPPLRFLNDAASVIYHMNILILLKTERMRCEIFWLKKIVKMHDDRATDHYSRIFQIFSETSSAVQILH